MISEGISPIPVITMESQALSTSSPKKERPACPDSQSAGQVVDVAQHPSENWETAVSVELGDHHEEPHCIAISTRIRLENGCTSHS